VNVLEALIFVEAVSAAALVWVDARTRLPRPAAAWWALGTLGTLGLAAPVYLIVRPTGRPHWGFVEVAALPLFFVLAMLPLSLFSESFAPHLGLLSSLEFIFALTALQNAVFAGAALYVALGKYRLPTSSIGLAGGAWARRLVAAVIASGAALGGNIVGQNLTIFAAGLFVGSQAATDFVTKQSASTPVFRLLREFHAPADIVMLVVLVGFVVPVGEEIFFRGLAYGAFRRALGRHAAVLASAVFFAAAHVQPVEFFPILILGMILAYLYEYTGSLMPGMIAHAVNNLAALALFYVTPQPTP
jgi:membrane protease YdiL (CAAX protease family)